MGLVVVEAANPAHDALRMCTIGESEGKCLDWKRNYSMWCDQHSRERYKKLTVGCWGTSWSASMHKSRWPVTVRRRQCSGRAPWKAPGSPPFVRSAADTAGCWPIWRMRTCCSWEWPSPVEVDGTNDKIRIYLWYIKGRLDIVFRRD